MSRRLGILQCDEVSAELRAEFGDYPAMFIRELAPLRPDWSYRTYRVFEGELPERIDECEAYLATGSSFGVNDDVDWIRALASFVRLLAQERAPYVGVCFGHQMLASALGGRVATAKVGWGVGVHSVVHPDISVGSIRLPSETRLIVSHQDQVVETPPGMEILGGSDFCQVSWSHYGDTMLGIQGHPEFTADYAKALMETRRELIEEDAYRFALASLKLEPDARLTFDIIVRFVEEAIERST